jgi:hypothetical protein
VSESHPGKREVLSPIYRVRRAILRNIPPKIQQCICYTASSIEDQSARVKDAPCLLEILQNRPCCWHRPCSTSMTPRQIWLRVPACSGDGEADYWSARRSALQSSLAKKSPGEARRPRLWNLVSLLISQVESYHGISRQYKGSSTGRKVVLSAMNQRSHTYIEQHTLATSRLATSSIGQPCFMARSWASRISASNTSIATSSSTVSEAGGSLTTIRETTHLRVHH